MGEGSLTQEEIENILGIYKKPDGFHLIDVFHEATFPKMLDDIFEEAKKYYLSDLDYKREITFLEVLSLLKLDMLKLDIDIAQSPVPLENIKSRLLKTIIDTALLYLTLPKQKKEEETKIIDYVKNNEDDEPVCGCQHCQYTIDDDYDDTILYK